MGVTTMATAFDVGQGGRMGWGVVEECILEGGLARRALWDIDIVSIEGLEWLEGRRRLNDIPMFTYSVCTCCAFARMRIRIRIRTYNSA